MVISSKQTNRKNDNKSCFFYNGSTGVPPLSQALPTSSEFEINFLEGNYSKDVTPDFWRFNPASANMKMVKENAIEPPFSGSFRLGSTSYFPLSEYGITYSTLHIPGASIHRSR